MTNDIDVIIYSYKGKLVKDVVASVIANSSGNRNINVVLMDQHPLIRAKSFSEFPNIYYNHIFWDLQVSPLSYKRDAVEHSKAEYILMLGDNVLLNKNWDDTLVGFAEAGDRIISGNQVVALAQESLFYIEKNLTDTESFSLTNFIDRDFLFFPIILGTKESFGFYKLCKTETLNHADEGLTCKKWYRN